MDFSMKLHYKKEVFNEVVEAVAIDTGIPEEFIEKDYFVSLLLKEIVSLNPNIIFKGGTSLSKCYQVIQRFSEDIDINIHSPTKINNRNRKELKESIISAIDNTNLHLINPQDIKSRRDFNVYKVSFPTIFELTGNLRDHLLIETFVSLKSYPTEKKVVNNYISDYLTKEYPSFIEEFNISGFEIHVQSMERTLIDKIFAVCDYYEKGQIPQNSRHLYDIHKIWSKIEFDNKSFLRLLNQVAIDRYAKPTINLSSKNGYELIKTLNNIISLEIYKEDYESITASLLFSECTYDESIRSLKEIIDSGFVPNVVGQSI